MNHNKKHWFSGRLGMTGLFILAAMAIVSAVETPEEAGQSSDRILSAEPDRSAEEQAAFRPGSPETAPTAQPASETEITAYLRQPPSSVNHVENSAAYQERNELMNALRERAQDKHAVTGLLLDIYRDEAQGEILQAYAIQHLSGWVRDGKAEGADREQALAAIRAAAAAWDREFLGGAGLLALEKAAGAEAAQPALAALSDPKASDNSRISAFQVCGALGEQRALAAAERAAHDENSSFVLRVSAISALAALKGRRAEAALRTLAQDRNQQVRRAAELALARVAPVASQGNK